MNSKFWLKLTDYLLIGCRCIRHCKVGIHNHRKEWIKDQAACTFFPESKLLSVEAVELAQPWSDQYIFDRLKAGHFDIVFRHHDTKRLIEAGSEVMDRRELCQSF